MKLTGAAILVSRGTKVLQAAPAAYPDRSASGGDALANGVGHWPESQVPTLDSEGLMVPPWVKFPDLPATPVGWWRGDQEYRAEFREWWDRQPLDARVCFRK
jgi:hypothetical protein